MATRSGILIRDIYGMDWLNWAADLFTNGTPDSRFLVRFRVESCESKILY